MQKDLAHFAFCKALKTLLRKAKKLRTLSLSHCGIGQQAMDAISQALTGKSSTCQLQSLGLRGNNLKLEQLATFFTACREKSKIKLTHIDFSQNQLTDQAGVVLARSFKNMKTLDHINLKDNSLGNDASEALLFLLKENVNITRCNVEHNMVKYTAQVEIDNTCKKNKAIRRNLHLPFIRREIKGLRKQRERQGVQGLFVEDMDQIKAQLKRQQ